MLRLVILFTFALCGCVTVEHPYATSPTPTTYAARAQYEAPAPAPQSRFLPSLGGVGFECGHIDVDEAYLIALGCWVAIQH